MHSRCEYLGKHIEHASRGNLVQYSETAYEPLLVDGAELIEHHLTGGSAESYSNARWI